MSARMELRVSPGILAKASLVGANTVIPSGNVMHSFICYCRVSNTCTRRQHICHFCEDLVCIEEVNMVMSEKAIVENMVYNMVQMAKKGITYG